MHVLVAGCGWLGTAVARACLARGDRVTGIRRTPAGARELEAQGIEPLVLDLTDPASAARLPPDVAAIVACQAAGGESVEAYRAAYLEATRTLLAAAERLPLRALVYTGSTGVFGQQDGSEVTEDTRVAPASVTAQVLVEAERQLEAAAARGVPARLLRLAGLYGPGRIGLIERVRSGALALGPGDERWMNWIHLDDAVSLVLAVLERGHEGRPYHGVDATPLRRREVVEWLAGALGIPPPLSEGRGTPGAGRGGAHRRISSAATRAELGVSLAYPSLREGLAPWLGTRQGKAS